MTDFKDSLVRMLILAIFVVGIITLTASLISDNGNVDLFAEDENLNATFQNLTASLESTQGIAINQSDAQDLTKPIAIFDFLFESIIGTGKVFKAVASVVYNVLFGYLLTRLSIPPIFLYAIVTMWVIIMILGAWKLFKTAT